MGILGYSHAIRVLGVSKAALFPCAVPAASLLIGIPVLGEIPSAEQVAGMAMVTVGLLVAIGLFRRLYTGR
jgi:drug/metabolite transporter (DMT)-like permease